MNHPEMAERFELAMELSGFTNASRLAKKSGIDRGYLYRLANGEIGTPHKYLEQLAKTMNVNPNWLGYGRGGPYDHERKRLQQGAFRATVTVVPAEGEDYDIELTIPDIFSSLRHVPKEPERYRFIYIPEMNDFFPAYTLLTVEKEPRPGPGIFVAWYITGQERRLGCYQEYFKKMEQVSTRNQKVTVQPIGRVRNMDYWKADEIGDPPAG